MRFQLFWWEVKVSRKDVTNVVVCSLNVLTEQEARMIGEKAGEVARDGLVEGAVGGGEVAVMEPPGSR